ncbi:hypothetical protein Trco_004752 [Trichoderma cornu-damae]|uniref:Uncharacterized protein n=1 Tax=Trichoderma cornu-damae TaxID=654480 RepID=A0A9P8TUK6_9HYPO|nr:hypothetical protein Trco_004752 [Trichoderma cornu-damae]
MERTYLTKVPPPPSPLLKVVSNATESGFFPPSSFARSRGAALPLRLQRLQLSLEPLRLLPLPGDLGLQCLELTRELLLFCLALRNKAQRLCEGQPKVRVRLGRLVLVPELPDAILQLDGLGGQLPQAHRLQLNLFVSLAQFPPPFFQVGNHICHLQFEVFELRLGLGILALEIQVFLQRDDERRVPHDGADKLLLGHLLNIRKSEFGEELLVVYEVRIQAGRGGAAIKRRAGRVRDALTSIVGRRVGDWFAQLDDGELIARLEPTQGLEHLRRGFRAHFGRIQSPSYGTA